MKAAVSIGSGPLSVIRVDTAPIPQPGPRQILIQLFTAGVGEWDESIRDGLWRPDGRAKFPLILGTDGAGIVVMKGPRVRRFRVGDRAYGYAAGNAKGGFYAEYVVLNEREAAPAPRGLDLLQAEPAP